MTENLKPGDRVRVATNVATSGCQPGDKGTVLTGPILHRGEVHYIVAIDKRGADSTSAMLKAEEIEPDA